MSNIVVTFGANSVIMRPALAVKPDEGGYQFVGLWTPRNNFNFSLAVFDHDTTTIMKFTRSIPELKRCSCILNPAIVLAAFRLIQFKDITLATCRSSIFQI